MHAFEWNERYLTGIGDVDSQHLELVALINRIGELEAGGATADALRPILRELVEYAGYHFTVEEDLIRKSGCDARHLAGHVAAHAEFARQMSLFSTLVEAGRRDSFSSMLGYLIGWLAYHILGEDKAMAGQIAAIAAGSQPAEAYARHAARPDAASAVLIEALGNLYDHLAVVNHELIEANRDLEQRVAERTGELRRANQQLQREHEAQQVLIRKLEDAQGQLLQSEKLASIGQLAAGVAHEINNPVGFVNSNLGTLKAYVERMLALCDAYLAMESSMTCAPAQRETLQRLKEAADLEFLRQDIVDLLHESQDGLGRVKRIVQDLRDFSHVDNAEWQEADLNAGLDSTLNVVWNEVKYKARVIKEYGSLPPVRCIASQINQVFLNLIVNASQAIADAGTITLRSGTRDDHAWVEVEDTGCGIAPEVQKRIFDPFYTTKPVGKGTGLGLSLAYGIVTKHGGRIDVRSAPGEGSSFRVWLPLSGEPSAQAAPPP